MEPPGPCCGLRLALSAGYASDKVLTLVTHQLDGARLLDKARDLLEWLNASRLLLIRLFQQTTSGRVEACRARHFRKPCANSRRSSLPRTPASSTWPYAVGRMALSVRVVGTGAPTSW